MYMDPQEYAKKGVDKVYPDYNWLPNNAVQRGTLKYSSTRGDPLTPGYPSVGKNNISEKYLSNCPLLLWIVQAIT